MVKTGLCETLSTVPGTQWHMTNKFFDCSDDGSSKGPTPCVSCGFRTIMVIRLKELDGQLRGEGLSERNLLGALIRAEIQWNSGWDLKSLP